MRAIVEMEMSNANCLYKNLLDNYLRTILDPVLDAATGVRRDIEPIASKPTFINATAESFICRNVKTKDTECRDAIAHALSRTMDSFIQIHCHNWAFMPDEDKCKEIRAEYGDNAEISTYWEGDIYLEWDDIFASPWAVPFIHVKKDGICFAGPCCIVKNLKTGMETRVFAPRFVWSED